MNFKEYLTETSSGESRKQAKASSAAKGGSNPSTNPQLASAERHLSASQLDGINRIKYKMRKGQPLGGHAEPRGPGKKTAKKALKRLRKGRELTVTQKNALKHKFKNADALNAASDALGSDYVGSKVYGEGKIKDLDTKAQEGNKKAKKIIKKLEKMTEDQDSDSQQIAAKKDAEARLAHVKANVKQRVAIATRVAGTRKLQTKAEHKESRKNLRGQRVKLKGEEKKALMAVASQSSRRISRINRESSARKKDARKSIAQASGRSS